VILGLYLASQIIGIINGSLYLFKDYLLPDYVHLFYVGYPVVFSWVALYYLFICSLLDTRFRIKSYIWLHFLPFIIVLFLLTSQFYLFGSEEKLRLIENSSDFNKLIRVLDIIFSFQVIAYNIAVIVKYNSYRKRVKEITNIKPEYDTWIRIAIFTFLIACIITILGKSFLYLELPVKFKGFLISDLAFLFFYSILFFFFTTSSALDPTDARKGNYWYFTLSSL